MKAFFFIVEGHPPPPCPPTSGTLGRGGPISCCLPWAPIVHNSALLADDLCNRDWSLKLGILARKKKLTMT